MGIIIRNNIEYTGNDKQIYDWALEPNKPTYTAHEVGAATVDHRHDDKLNTSLKGVAGGLAELDDTGKVPESQLPTIPTQVTESTVSEWGFTKNTGTYTKPDDGIPKSDLSEDIQSSLDKADSALQEFTETDPTVPSYVKSITEKDITNWNNKAEQSDIPDVSGFALTSESGYDLGLSIDSKTYIMTLELKNKAGTVLSKKTLDFPIESMVVNASYKDGIITLTLQNGETLSVNISALVGGLVNDTFTIAGIDMKDDITAAELKTALAIPTEYTVKDWGFTKNDGDVISELAVDFEEAQKPEFQKAIDDFEDELSRLSESITEISDDVKIMIDTSPNLFNKDSDNLMNGYYSGSFQSNSGYRMTHPIKLKANVYYKYKQSSSLGGNVQVPYFTSESEDIKPNQYNATGTLKDGFVTVKFAIDVLARFNIGNTADVDTFMLCVADEYPNEYMPYGKNISNELVEIVSKNIEEGKKLNENPLFGKKVVFDGDSISYGANDTKGRGWGSRIGNKNKMDWQNVSVSGGTVAVVSGRHNLCTYIDTIHNNNPTLDYFIFDGGTNDADALGETKMGEIAYINYAGKQFGDFTGNYDMSTFCGGFETLIYKVLQYYPKAKIGYIVAPKMGVWGGSSVNAMLLPKIREQYFEKAKEICKKWGVPFIDLWSGSTLNPCLLSQYDRDKSEADNIALGHPYSVDAQHPNYMGYEMIVPMIEAWMKTL